MPAPSITTIVDDLSTRVNSTGTYNSAIVIAAKKGPIDTPIKVSSQTDFLRRFTPNEKLEVGYEVAYFEAFKYLEQQNGLYVVRAAHTIDSVDDEDDYVAKYGACILKLEDSPNDNRTLLDAQSGLDPDKQGLVEITDYTLTSDEAVLIYGADPGVYNNDISIIVITDQKQVKLENAFLIKVYKNNVLVETHTCSLDPNLKNGYGVTCDIEEVLQSSNYIRAYKKVDKETITTKSYAIDVEVTNGETKTYQTGYAKTAWTEAEDGSNVEKDDQGNITAKLIDIDDVYQTKYCQEKFHKRTSSGISYKAYYREPERTFTYYKLVKASPQSYKGYKELYLTGGNDGSGVVPADRIRALKTLGNINDINIQLVMQGDDTSIEYTNAIADLCDKREKSCHGIISTKYEDEVDANALGAIQQYRNYDLNLNNYSMEMYTPHQKYYDEFNDRYIYLSPGPYVASLIMQTAQERGWHWAVAGYNRGVVPSLDVAATFEPAIVDELSDMQVNTIIKDPGAGNIIWDELTQWSQAADLQDAHIARYVNIYLRPRLKELLKSFLFEFNDEETRSLVVRKIASFMETQKASRAVYAYRVVCDETNNLDNDIENNILNSWLYIKPTKIAKFIRQRIILTEYGASLEDLEV